MDYGSIVMIDRLELSDLAHNIFGNILLFITATMVLLISFFIVTSK